MVQYRSGNSAMTFVYLILALYVGMTVMRKVTGDDPAKVLQANRRTRAAAADEGTYDGRLPFRIELEEAQDILQRGVHGMAHVELPCHVGWGHNDGKGLSVRISLALKTAALFPFSVNSSLGLLGLINLRQFFYHADIELEEAQCRIFFGESDQPNQIFDCKKFRSAVECDEIIWLAGKRGLGLPLPKPLSSHFL